MVSLLLATASAASIAVLSFDGYGVDWSDTEAVTNGVRDAFLVESSLNPLSGSDIADALTAPYRVQLASARESVAEARRAYQGRDAAAALPLVDEALDLHYASYSDVSRRPELADAWYLRALCAYALEKDDEAAEGFREAAFLYPRYIGERAGGLPSSAISLAAGAQAEMETGRRRVRTTDNVRAIGDLLGVEYVVIGWVTGEGEIVGRIYEGGAFVAEHTEALSGLPAPPLDDAYGALAGHLAKAVGARGSRTESRYVPLDEPEERAPVRQEPRALEPERSPVREPSRSTRSDPDEEREAEEAREAAARAARRQEEARAAERRDAEARRAEEEEAEARRAEKEEAAREAAEKAQRERAAAARAREEEVREREEAREAERRANPPACAEEDAPITCKWWFWAAAAGGAGGISALLGYAAWEPPPDEVPGAPTWSVEIAP